MAADDNFRFSEGDNLLCYHGPMLYEAKCLKIRMNTEGCNRAEYFIHYKGWNSNWDEWVNDDRVLDINMANMKKMTELKEKYSNSNKNAEKCSHTTNKDIIKTSSVKVVKHEYSKTSLESIVKSPIVPKEKKTGDNLLCYHGPMLYEAKCLKIRMNTEGCNRAEYFIHYKGWNSNWDEWVNDDRVLDINMANMKKMTELKEKYSNSNKNAEKCSHTTNKDIIKTSSVKVVKHEYSKTSLESVVKSPIVPKEKKTGDNLLCYHGPMLYEAKCLKIRMNTEGCNRAEYFIHYKGWNSNWDEWVNDDRVLDINMANMKKMTELKEKYSNSNKNAEKCSHTTNKDIIKTSSVKVVKHEYSKTSLESVVKSPIVPKEKKTGDNLLCYHGPMLYEAKCLKIRMNTEGCNRAEYFIHYKGWNSNWDEWVNDDRVLDINMANMKKMTELKEKYSNSNKNAEKCSHTTNKDIIKTSSVKVVKHEYSKTSLESVVKSPIVLNEKKTGDNLLCYHGPMLYEAKCLKIRMNTEGCNRAEYFIHYKGWNSNWDEWVNDDRVLDINMANMKKMTELKEKYSNSNKNAEKCSHTTNKDIIKTSSVKVVKHEYSKTSLESIVKSPIVLNEKKRGRFSETTVNTSEPLEINEEQKLSKVNYPNKVQLQQVVKRTKSDKIIEAVNETVKVTDGTDKGNGLMQFEEDFSDVMVGFSMSTIIQIKDMPLILKRRLSQDNIIIENENRMLIFFENNTIDLLFRDYMCSTSELSVKEQEISKVISLTLIQYFNWYIHTQLLYNIEREKNIIKKATFYLHNRIKKGLLLEYPVNKDLFTRKLWHYVYGPSFLLRLLVKWPNLNRIPSEKYNAEQTKIINEYLACFLKYLEDNYEKYFSDQNYK